MDGLVGDVDTWLPSIELDPADLLCQGSVAMPMELARF
jgi:hypothetical protein